VRENVRNAMRQKPYAFSTLELALKWIAARFQIPLEQWIRRSELLKSALFQKKITDFFGRQSTA
jgi:hypothetical protein